MFEVFGSNEVGAFYGGANILGANIAFVCVTVCWVSLWMFLFFGACHYAGFLRLSVKEEDETLDGAVDTKDGQDIEVEL